MLLEAVVVEVARSAAAGSILILLLLAEVVLVLLVVLLLLLLTTAMVPLLSCLMASAAKNGAVAIESLPFFAKSDRRHVGRCKNHDGGQTQAPAVHEEKSD